MRVLPNPKRGEPSEGHTTQRRTDHGHPEARRGRVNHGGVVPAARDQRADLLPLESEVRRDGKRGCEKAEATGAGEPEVETPGDARQSRAERGAGKKLLAPAGLRAAASYLMVEYPTHNVWPLAAATTAHLRVRYSALATQPTMHERRTARDRRHRTLDSPNSGLTELWTETSAPRHWQSRCSALDLGPIEHCVSSQMRRPRGQQLLLAVGQVTDVKTCDLESVAVGNRVRGTSFHAICAKTAAVVIDVADLRIGFGAAHSVLGRVLRRLNINAV